jgi:hypothetical protein
MKMMIFSLLMAPIFSFAQSMPESATEPMPLEDVLVVCTFADKNLDLTSVSVSADGKMVAQMNPKYVFGEIAPYLAYTGLDVVTSEESVRITGTLLAIAGQVNVDVTVQRGKKNNVKLLDEDATCEAK